MAAPRIFSLSRTLLTKQTLNSFLLPRSFSSTTTTTTATATFSVLRVRLLSTLASYNHHSLPSSAPFSRTFSTRQSQTSLNDNSPNWSNRPPKETILLDGCDFEHWLVVTEPPPEGATRDDIIDSYIKTLAQVVGSEEEARMKIYSVSTRHYYAFGALVSEELSYKLKELPNVRWVLPDSYLDVKNKDYGGEPFINGQAVPYDPKYHEEWVRNNQKAQERNRRNDRPRNADRSRNFERRQRNTGFQNNPNMGGQGGNAGGPPNMGGMPNQPPGNMGGQGYNNAGSPPNMGGMPNQPPGNMGGQGYNNAGGPPNMGGMPNQPRGPPNMPPNNPAYGPNNPGYGQHSNPGYGQQMPPTPNNPGFANSPNRGMPPPNYGGQGNPGYQQGGGMPYQNQQNYGPQGNMGGQPGGYQGQDVPGRDTPQYQ